MGKDLFSNRKSLERFRDHNPEVSDISGHSLRGGIPSLSESIEDFAHLVYEAVSLGRPLILASDVTDCLAHITSDRCTPYPGVREGLQELLALEVPIFLISGDSKTNILERFLLPCGLASSSGTPESIAGIQNLTFLTQSGVEITTVQNGAFTTGTHLTGIEASFATELKLFLESEITERFMLHKLFGSKYAAQGLPGYVELSGGAERNDISLTYFPYGHELTSASRAELAQNTEDHGIRIAIAERINEFIVERGHPEVVAVIAGKTSIDIGTAHKGTAISKLRNSTLPHNAFVIYFGDTISNGGNDLSAAITSDLAVQVGRPTGEDVSFTSLVTAPLLRVSSSPLTGGLIPYFNIIRDAQNRFSTGTNP